MDSLISKVEGAINASDVSEAVRILTEEDVTAIDPERLGWLVEVALKDGKIHRYYLAVVDRLTPFVALRLARELGESPSSPPAEVAIILQDEHSVERRDAIVSAYVENDGILAPLFAHIVGRVSPAVQAMFNKALVESDESEADIAKILLNYPAHRDEILEAFIKANDVDECYALVRELPRACLTDAQAAHLLWAMCKHA